MNEENNEDLTHGVEQTYTRRRRTERYDEQASEPENKFVRHASSYSIVDPEPDPYTRRQVTGSYPRRPSASRYHEENNAARRSQSAYSQGVYPDSGYSQRYPEDPVYIGQGSFSRPAGPTRGRDLEDQYDDPVVHGPDCAPRPPIQRGSASRTRDIPRKPVGRKPAPEKAHPILHLFVVLFLLAGCTAICFHLVPEGKLTWVDDARETVTGFVVSFLAPEVETGETGELVAPEAVAFPEEKPLFTATPTAQPQPEPEPESESLPIDDSGLPPEING